MKIRLFHIFACGLIGFSFNARGEAPTMSGVSGVTSSSITDALTTINGGLAGSDSTCSGHTELCDNCGTGSDLLVACNRSRIYNNLDVTFTVSTKETAGSAILTKDDKTVITDIETNSLTSVTITWSNICANAFGDNSNSVCESIGDGKITGGHLRIYIDKNNNGSLEDDESSAGYVPVTVNLYHPADGDWNVYGTPNSQGIGKFRPYPGDEKFRLEDVDSHTNFPAFTDGKFTGVRVFVSDESLENAAPGLNLDADKSDDLALNSDGQFADDPIIEGLENGKLYAVRIAMLDEGQNVIQFFPDHDAEAACAAPLNPNTCDYVVEPSEVLGLLSKDLNCFVATAAYGSSLEPRLKVFRQFRNKILLPTLWGRKFVFSYYKYGPFAARYIANKPVVRSIVQVLLWPLYGFSELALKLGLSIAICIALGLGLLFSTLAFWITKRAWAKHA